MADINATRRRKLLQHVAANGGAMDIGPLHDWAGLKLLAAHQAFSQLMEGLTDDGLLGWDGKTFTMTDAGRAAIGLEPEAAAPAPAPPVAPAAPAPPPAAAPPVMAAPPSAAPPAAAAAPGARADDPPGLTPLGLRRRVRGLLDRLRG